MSDFRKFFCDATGILDGPFPFQERFATGKDIPGLVDIPTGLGKTAMAILGWLWRRRFASEAIRAATPRRLVYCLPMRTLVEQTRVNADEWLKNLANAGGLNGEKIAVSVLMGGEDKTDWDLYPERDAIIIGTQDMLLSRALNRGYAASRARWPMQFGLLNNDCLWIFDEVQLLGNGMATGIQLDAFRLALWPTAKAGMSCWMSATNSADVFDTTDRKELKIQPPKSFGLLESDRLNERVKLRLNAEKRINFLTKAPKLRSHEDSRILDQHQSGRMTLIILNTVKSALQFHAEIAAELNSNRNTKRKPPPPTPELILLHSRFRPMDRRQNMQRLENFIELAKKTGVAPDGHPGLIVIATQVVEAGIDLSSSILWSELAPWPSVIQRLGRLNRDNRQRGAVAQFWTPRPEDDENRKDLPNAGRIGPYEKSALKQAEKLIRALIGELAKDKPYRVALDDILASEEARSALQIPLPIVIRPDDVYGLFSTEPDLAGGFTNISPFIRTTEPSSDVTIYYREFKGSPPIDLADPAADEIVQIPCHQLSGFLKSAKHAAFLWDEDAERWQSIPAWEVVPGMTLLLPSAVGGYSEQCGWTGKTEDKPKIPDVHRSPHSSLFAEWESKVDWQTLSDHTADVESAVVKLGSALALPPDRQAALVAAAKWHDVGKAHSRWQAQLIGHSPRGQLGPWGKFKDVPTFRPGVRHEAFSLLFAWERLQAGDKGLTALALYLIASHHGKVRTTLRSTGVGNNLFGWHSGDEPLSLPGHALCKIDLSVKNFASQGILDQKAMQYYLKRPSWNCIVDELLGPPWRGDPITQIAIPAGGARELGPFELAYLEAVFRASDIRASRGEFSQGDA